MSHTLPGLELMETMEHMEHMDSAPKAPGFSHVFTRHARHGGFPHISTRKNGDFTDKNMAS